MQKLWDNLFIRYTYTAIIYTAIFVAFIASYENIKMYYVLSELIFIETWVDYALRKRSFKYVTTQYIYIMSLIYIVLMRPNPLFGGLLFVTMIVCGLLSFKFRNEYRLKKQASIE